MECPKCGHHFKNYKNPLPTVDIIIEVKDGIVLVARKNEPRGWALPGGFVDYGESLEEAAVREAMEETGLHVTLLQQLKTYSAPDRDPRQHTISTVFIATADGLPHAGDDAADTAIFTRHNLPSLVFDHARIVDDYFARKDKNSSP